MLVVSCSDRLVEAFQMCAVPFVLSENNLRYRPRHLVPGIEKLVIR